MYIYKNIFLEVYKSTYTDAMYTTTHAHDGIDHLILPVKMEGSGWSKDTAFMGQKLLKSYCSKSIRGELMRGRVVYIYGKVIILM